MVMKVLLFFTHRLGYARISHGGLSDTEIQVGRFHIPDHPNNAVDHNHIVKDPAQIDEDIRFSSRYLSTDLFNYHMSSFLTAFNHQRLK